MNLATPILRQEKMRIAGELVGGDRVIEVRNPYNGQVIGTVPKASIEQLRAAYDKVAAYKPTLSRYDRSKILRTTGGDPRQPQERDREADHAGIGPEPEGHAVRGRPRL